MTNKVFGIDLGTTNIKVVWLDKQKDTFFLNSVLSSPTVGKGLFSESPLDQQELAQGIIKIVTDASITAKNVNIALPESQVFTRVIEMPPLSDKELSSAIFWEAEQYIPVPLDSLTLDYKVLRRPTADDNIQKMNVLLVGAPTMLINKYQKILSLAGFTLASVETEILSCVRSLGAKDDFPTSLVINIGSVSSCLAIVRKGSLVFTYPIPTGGLAISRAIAADFGFQLSQAEEYKKVYGLSENNFGGKIGKAASPVLSSLVIEAKKAITFYSQKYPQDPIKQIILSGGTAKLPGLNIFFVNNMGIETVIANPWKILENQDVPQEILDDAPEYSIAVGLAMRDYE